MSSFVVCLCRAICPSALPPSHPALLPCVSSLPHRLPTRVRMEYLDDGTAVRVAARSGAIIERPSILMERRNPRRAAGLMDTAASDVVLETNDGAHPRLKQF